MKKNFIYLLIGITTLWVTGCAEDNDDVAIPSTNLEVSDFVWKAMNFIYIYKDEVDNLADDAFANTEEYVSFLESFNTPEALFDDLITPDDRFSIIVSDYRDLEAALQGNSVTNGLRIFSTTDDITGQFYLVVAYVVNGSSADFQGVERGMVITEIDGVTLTPDNVSSLSAPTTYTIGIADFNGTTYEPNGQTFTLTKENLTENPVHIVRTLDINGEKIGYLMYNGFRANFVNDLNQAFAQFSADGVTDLVLDLRYNGGGRITNAEDLSSMITGQFNNQLYAVLTYNGFQPDDSLNFDNQTDEGESTNSLNLQRVYVLTTTNTASASELVINALNPYIDVIQIGTNTAGKYQGSITVYDSQNLTKNGPEFNLGHFYALQPLISETENSTGFTGFDNGLIPDIIQNEDLMNLGVLGDPGEPLLARALQEIGVGFQEGDLPVFQRQNLSEDAILLNDSYTKALDYQRMYTDIK
jgi:C-terminal processing protease CtpA/Prc